jgi:Ribonuclease G/E
LEKFNIRYSKLNIQNLKMMNVEVLRGLFRYIAFENLSQRVVLDFIRKEKNINKKRVRPAVAEVLEATAWNVEF